MGGAKLDSVSHTSTKTTPEYFEFRADPTSGETILFKYSKTTRQLQVSVKVGNEWLTPKFIASW